VVTFNQVTGPSTTRDGLHAPGLRFGDARVMAVLSAILGFVHCLVGFTNAELVERVGPLLESLSYSSRQATYDLRRLTRKGVITRIPGTQRYLLTPFGRRIATWFTKAHSRVLTPGLAWTDPALPAEIASPQPPGRHLAGLRPRRRGVHRRPVPRRPSTSTNSRPTTTQPCSPTGHINATLPRRLNRKGPVPSGDGVGPYVHLCQA
jgi:hypothetical protein